VKSINRREFFDALRQFIPTQNAHELRIFPDRIEVCRFVRGEDGRVLFDGAGNLYHVVETHPLVMPEDDAAAVDNPSSDRPD
jgi:hypothetical protein